VKIFLLGIGDWGLGIGDLAQYPNTKKPKPKTPTQKPQKKKNLKKKKILFLKKIIFLIKIIFKF